MPIVSEYTVLYKISNDFEQIIKSFILSILKEIYWIIDIMYYDKKNKFEEYCGWLKFSPTNVQNRFVASHELLLNGYNFIV